MPRLSMRFGFTLALIAATISHIEIAAAQTWYWCAAVGAYYPYVTTCSVPWRAVAPQPSITTQSPPWIWNYGSMLLQRRMQGFFADDQDWYQHPERHCEHPALRSQGAINGLNSTLGRPNGVPALVERFQEPMVPVGNQQDPRQSNCHVTLIFANGLREAGTMHVDDPGGTAPLNFTWNSDAKAAADQQQELPRRNPAPYNPADGPPIPSARSAASAIDASARTCAAPSRDPSFPSYNIEAFFRSCWLRGYVLIVMCNGNQGCVDEISARVRSRQMDWLRQIEYCFVDAPKTVSYDEVLAHCNNNYMAGKLPLPHVKGVDY